MTSEDSETLDSEERDDFDDPRIIEIGSAPRRGRPPRSRSRSKPASCRSRKRRTTAPTWMASRVSTSRYVVDGGVLVNRPLRPALRAIFAQPAGPQIRRVVVGVVPDPGEAMKETADDRAEVPELAEIATASLVTFLATRRSATSSTTSTTTTRASTRSAGDVSLVAVLDLDAFAIAAAQYRDVRADRLTDWLFNASAAG